MAPLKLLLLILASGMCVCDAYRILGVFPFNVKSHFIMFDRLMKGLTNRGHRVDMVSFYPPSEELPNYRQIVKFNGSTATNNVTFEALKEDVIEFVATVGGNVLCEELGHPQIQQLVRNPPDDPPYDLLITEIFGAQCFLVLGHLLKIPMIGITSSEFYPWMNDMIANPENLAWVPNNMLENVDESDLLSCFWSRLYNTVKTIYMKMKFNCLSSVQDDIIRKHFGPDMPGLRQLESKLALVLANYHVSLSNVQPSVPGLIQVGGLHIDDEDNTVLSQELEEWLNDAEEGFIYLSFGSMVKLESFPEEIKSAFYRTLGTITPVRVLIKTVEPEKLPSNIYTLPWLPQKRILKHPKIRAFITHGGMLGTQEAIYYGVPLIGVPLFADQFKNINNYVRRNIALKLDLKDFSEKKLNDTLHEILYNPIYKKSMKRASQMFRDRPQSPLDTACYWVEYVIKYGDESLKSPAMQLTWWQISLLDVYGFLAMIFALSFYIITLTVKQIVLALERFLKGKVHKVE